MLRETNQLDIAQAADEAEVMLVPIHQSPHARDNAEAPPFTPRLCIRAATSAGEMEAAASPEGSDAAIGEREGAVDDAARMDAPAVGTVANSVQGPLPSSICEGPDECAVVVAARDG